MHRNANYATRELEAQSYGQYAKTSRPFIHQHLLTKSSTLICLSRTSRSYKNHCFLPGGNNTSPILMFLSLKLDIGGHEPTIMHNAPSWSSNRLLGQSNKKQRRTCKNTQEEIYKSRTK